MTRSSFPAWFAAVFFLPAPVLHAQGFSPEEAVRRMKVPDGFRVRLVASEPLIRQPLSITFDERGRPWVIQYLQYPTPAGLKPVSVDQYLRTEYDRVPEPPPRGPKGADRITILEDPDENGRYRKAKDFVTGLNLCTGLAIGHGGVFVLQAPYLLFYPDRDGDDVPDGDPEVLLTGFGMQDSHAFANSLQWGPDGWLYGVQGSTVTAKIRGLEFQQGIWRYHPRTRQFELFSEGGGNTWGLDFDRHGNALAGTNFGHSALLHQVQGGYYVKGFSKHGPLHNPHTYGYFEHVPYKGFKGGHVTIGGIVYQGGAYPDRFNDCYIAGNLLANALYWHVLEPQGSTFTAHFGGDFLVANDTWFRPVDCLTGPDGAVYVVDWYDKRANHVDPVDNWDRSNGRIYRVEAEWASPPEKFNLARLSGKELVGLLSHKNSWFRGEARRQLAERRDASVLPELRRLLETRTDDRALEALWALYVCGGFNEPLADGLLRHANPDVRTWTVRLLGDAGHVTDSLRDHLVGLARSETNPTVLSQLACSAKRLPASACLPVVRELLHHDEVAGDPFLPLLIWWAVEDKAISDRAKVLSLLDGPSAWRSPLVRQVLAERLARRYMAEGGEADLQACASLLASAPGPAEVDNLVAGMEKALEGRALPSVPPALKPHLDALWHRQPLSLRAVRFGLRLGSPEAYDGALQWVSDSKRPENERASLVEVLGQLSGPRTAPTLLGVLTTDPSARVRQSVLAALPSFPEPGVAATVLEQYPRWPADLRRRAQDLLLSRPDSALEFLRAVDASRIDKKDVSPEQLRRVVSFHKEPLTALVEKHWGKVGPLPPGEKIARIRSVNHILNQGKGDPARGKPLFQKHCATCHTLFGEGNKIGPELTGADRKNREVLLTNIIDPSAFIRPEYIAYKVTLTDGRVLTGLVAEATPQAVTLLDDKNQRTVLARSRIEELAASPQSLMPEKILDPLTDQEIRDFFSYLQGDGPPAPGSEPAARDRLTVCLVSGSLEYHSDESLAAFQKYLEANYPVRCTRAFRKADDDLPGLENLDSCDVMLLFTRRLTPRGEQLERVKRYCLSGKPIVAVRTASHAFQNWLALDREILGGNYQGHYGQEQAPRVEVNDRAKGHPVLAGVKPFRATGGLYRNPEISKDVEVLLTGAIPEHTEPVAWTRAYKGGRIFYTSLGHPEDFKDANFVRLLVNALFWTTRRDVPRP